MLLVVTSELAQSNWSPGQALVPPRAHELVLFLLVRIDELVLAVLVPARRRRRRLGPLLVRELVSVHLRDLRRVGRVLGLLVVARADVARKAQRDALRLVDVARGRAVLRRDGEVRREHLPHLRQSRVESQARNAAGGAIAAARGRRERALDTGREDRREW